MLTYVPSRRAYWRDDEPFALGAARATAALRSIWQARYFNHQEWIGFCLPSGIDAATSRYGLEPDGPTARRLVFVRWLHEQKGLYDEAV